MTYDHPNICVEEPHPGYYVASYTPRPVTTEQGILVPPGILIVPAEVPADLLRALADAKEGRERPARPRAAAARTATVSTAAVVSTASPADAGTGADAGSDAGAPPLATRVVNVLLADANNKLRVNVIAEVLGVEMEEVKALNGQGFTIGRAGWTTLNQGGAA